MRREHDKDVQQYVRVRLTQSAKVNKLAGIITFGRSSSSITAVMQSNLPFTHSILMKEVKLIIFPKAVKFNIRSLSYSGIKETPLNCRELPERKVMDTKHFRYCRVTYDRELFTEQHLVARKYFSWYWFTRVTYVSS